MSEFRLCRRFHYLRVCRFLGALEDRIDNGFPRVCLPCKFGVSGVGRVEERNFRDKPFSSAAQLQLEMVGNQLVSHRQQQQETRPLLR